MSPSRRDLLRLLSASPLLSVAGCTASGPAGGGDAETSRPTTTHQTATDEQAAFEMRLSGPATDRRLFDETGVATVGSVEDGRTGSFYVPIVLTDDARSSVSEIFRTAGVTETPDDFEIVLRYDGETVNRFGVAPSLAASVAQNEWEGRFRMVFDRRETAEDVRDTLSSADANRVGASTEFAD